MMNNDSKTEIDELFSAYIDDALTPRQQTELKRLLQNQPELAEQLSHLRRQRQLLSALPIETAPPTLLDDIKSQIERNLLLEQRNTYGLLNRAALLRRRITAAAAMLLLPMALLGYVLWQIVIPVTDQPPQRTTARSLLEDDTTVQAAQEDAPPAPVAPAALPFDGVLVLTTERPILTAQSIEKQIFLLSLEHQTIPNRTAEKVTFQIDCPTETLASFIESIKPLWRQILDSRLTLHDSDSAQRKITIPHIRPEQIQMLVRQTDKMPLRSMARQYASNNPPLNQAAGQPALAEDSDVTLENLPIPQPILAWPDQPQARTTTTQPHVQLLIEVCKPEESAN